MEEEEYEEMKITRVEYIFYNDINYFNKNEKEKESNNSKKYRIYINPKYIEYELILEKDLKDQILLTINENKKNEFIKYQIILNNDNTIKISPYFKLLYKINQLFYIDTFFSFLKSQLDKNTHIQLTNSIFNKNANDTNDFINIINIHNSKIYISHLNDNKSKIYLIFEICYCDLKKEEIKLGLDKIEQINDEDSLKIIEFSLKNKYNYLERMYDLKKKLQKTQKYEQKYRLLLDKCNQYFGQNMKNKMAFLDMGIDTDILNDQKEYIFIIKNISKIFKKKVLNFNQIYKASCNGDNINAFHKYCKNIPNTLILIITDEKRRFGGFTQAEWDDMNRNKFDDKAFLFSLDNFEIYPILDKYKDKAINCREDFYAPIFGEDLYLFDGFFSSQLNKTNEKFYNYSKSKIDNEYKLNGQEYFTVTEMEVYQVIFSQ